MSGSDNSASAPNLAALRAGPAGRRAWRKYWVRDPLNGGLDHLLHAAMPLLGMDGASAFGAAIARRSIPRHHPDWVARADAALAALRPDADARARAAMLDRRHAAIGRVMAEFTVLHRMAGEADIAVRGRAHLDNALAHDGPLILAGLHLGNWELSFLPAVLQRLSGFDTPIRPVHTIYQPPRSRFRHRLAVRARERAGARLLPPGRPAATAAMRVLRGNGIVWIALDDFRDRQVNGPLFGRPAGRHGNLAVAARLAAATGARVLPLYVVRNQGARFTLHAEPAPADWTACLEAARAGDVAPAVHALNQRVEPAVRAHLDQWFMLHELRLRHA